MENHQLMAAIQQQVAKNEEHQQTEWMPSVSGDENKLINALANNPINKSTVEELKQVLRLVMVKVGIGGNNLPSDGEKEVLLEHIISNYGNHTPEEIKIAFDLAILGKLDIDEKKVVCYENFTCLYFSGIMNAYRRWAVDIHSQLREKEPLLIDEKKNLTDQEWEEWIIDIKNYPLELIPIPCYDYLIRVEKISPTAKEKKEFFKKAIPIYSIRIQNDLRLFNEFTKQKFENKLDSIHKDAIVIISKQLIVVDYLKQTECP